MIDKIAEHEPKIGKDCYIAQSSVIVGDVEIGDDSSVFFGAVIRGDLTSVKIGSHTNVQDNSVIHVSRNSPTTIGDYVTVGHASVLHGCQIGNNCLIGIKSVIMDNAEIGENTIIGAMSFVAKGRKIPAGVLAIGTPAKVVRNLTPEEIQSIRGYADRTEYNVKSNYLAHSSNEQR